MKPFVFVPKALQFYEARPESPLPNAKNILWFAQVVIHGTLEIRQNTKDAFSTSAVGRERLK